MMPVDQFEKTLKDLLKREPFEPFVIERDIGDQFVVSAPKALFYLDGPQGLYFHANGEMDFINAEVVKRIYRLVPEPAGS
jgi:hypothetical protein